MRNLKNLFFFIADSLRYDSIPESIAREGILIKTAAPSLSTPVSFASIVSARNPQNHNVRSFFDALDIKIKTVFDFFKNGSYFDHPSDPMSKIVLKRCPPPKELCEMEEPFVWIERAMETHIPYGKIKHGNSVIELTRKDGLIGLEYKKSLYKGEIDPVRAYKYGVQQVEKHFWTHVKDLEKMGILEDTLIIFTSDHGELLGEYGCFTHNHPPCEQLITIPTVFFECDIDIRFMRSIDIVPTALELLGYNNKINFKSDGLNVLQPSDKYQEIIKNQIFNLTEQTKTRWYYDDEDDRIKLASYSRHINKLRFLRNRWIPIPIKAVYLNRFFNRALHGVKMKNYLL